MLHNLKTISVGIAATLLLAAGVSNLDAAAQSNRPAEVQERKEAAQEQRGAARTERLESGYQSSQKPEAASERLTANRLKACEKRQSKINETVGRLSERGSQQLDVFIKISERTQNFYLKQGNPLDNYAALVAEAEAKRDLAETAVATTQNHTFSCDSENPRQAIEDLKTKLADQRSALKDYRTAIKDLIVGVKSAQPVETDNTTDQEVQE